MSDTCKHCGGEIAARNPTGTCDHLYWPDMLTDEAKLANGFRRVTFEKWVPADDRDCADNIEATVAEEIGRW